MFGLIMMLIAALDLVCTIGGEPAWAEKEAGPASAITVVRVTGRRSKILRIDNGPQHTE